MNVSAYVFALIMVAGAAEAQSVIDQLCGSNHVNQTIANAVGSEYHLCTRPAATPDMHANQVMLLKNGRVIQYLFIPIEGCPRPVS